MVKPTLKTLTKLLRGFRKDGQVNISRHEGITKIRVMSDDYVSMFQCACHTGGDDYEEIALASIDISDNEITGDKQEKKLLIASLPALEDHQVNFNVGDLFPACIKKHSDIITGLHKDGSPYSKAVLAINDNVLVMLTTANDCGIKEEHRSELNVTETNGIEDFKIDAIKLYRSLFKYMIPEEVNIRIVRELAPLEVMFNIGGYQCHYIQAPMIDN